MAAFVIRRVAAVAVVLVASVCVVFVVFNVLPANAPVQDDRAFVVRLAGELERVFLRLDIGTGLQLGQRLPVTLELLAGGAVLSLVLGVAGGMVIGTRPRSLAARAVNVVAALALAAPVQWLSLMLLFAFASDIGWLPLPFAATQGSYRSLGEDPGAWAGALALPWLAVAAFPAAVHARVLGAALGESLREDYVRTAAAKGVGRRAIVWRHALRPALLPLSTSFGLSVVAFVNAAVLVEAIFNVPGVERLFVLAARQQNLPTVQDIVLVNVFGITVAGLVIDVLQAWLDPRRRR